MLEKFAQFNKSFIGDISKKGLSFGLSEDNNILYVYIGEEQVGELTLS